MKKISMLFTFILVILITKNVLAANTKIVLKGDDTAKENEEKTIVVNISSEESALGSISGVIENNENITIVDVKGKNNWNLTYNNDTGAFNVYKAEGSNKEDIMEIKCKIIGKEEKNAEIVIKEIRVSTIEYKEERLEDIKKEMKIESLNGTNVTNSTSQEVKQENKNEANKSSDKKYPYTGTKETLLPICILLIISIASYTRYKRIKI